MPIYLYHFDYIMYPYTRDEISIVDRSECRGIERLDLLTNYTDANTTGVDVIDSEGVDIDNDMIDEIMERRMMMG